GAEGGVAATAIGASGLAGGASGSAAASATAGSAFGADEIPASAAGCETTPEDTLAVVVGSIDTGAVATEIGSGTERSTEVGIAIATRIASAPWLASLPSSRAARSSMRALSCACLPASAMRTGSGIAIGGQEAFGVKLLPS